MKRVKGYLSVPSLEDVYNWEIYKKQKHMEDIKSEVHTDYDRIVKEETFAPDD
jgi:hypothetical protein